MKKIECELNNNQGLLITNKLSIMYFTNYKYQDRIEYILLIKKKYYFFINSLNNGNLKYRNTIIFFNYNDILKKINEILINNKIDELKIEIDNINFSNYKMFEQYIKIKIFSVKDIFKISRSIKSSIELNKIIQAQKINKKALFESINIIKIGISEIKLKKYLIEKLYFFGAQKLAFDPIIAFGINTSFPHHVSNNTKLKYGDFIMIDFGCIYDYYCSDMTRTFVFNYITPEQEEIYNIVLKTQNSTINYTKPGLTCSEIDLYARKILKKFKYEKFFCHSIGHSLGLNIHEYPSLNQLENYKLRFGNIITIEPGIYLKDKFGVRIEDMLFIEKKNIINITNTQKKLFIIK